MSTIMERLRNETRSQHEQTEQLLYTETLRAGTLSVAQYGHLLRTHATYHRALEQTIDRHHHFFEKYDPDSRRKTAWLLADLETLGLTLPDIANPFADWSLAELTGAAYVSEGSMLGGKTVWHYLQQSQPLRPLLEQACFYQGYGAETGARWRSFGTFVEDSISGLDPDDVVAGARRAFALYRTLFANAQPAVDQLDVLPAS